MENINPFGSSNTSDVPVQKFMGATVASFDCSVDYASQPGSCNIVLIQDDTTNDLFFPGVIGSPQYFSIVDSDNLPIFMYNGILESISRDTSGGDKTYKVTLTSALKILEAVTVILEGYTGYGSTEEGLPRYYSEDGYYTISEEDKQLGYLPDGVTMTPAKSYFETSQFSFSTNNANLSFTGMWGKIFNLLNVFAAYENNYIDDNGAVSVVSYAGYGASSSVKGGMRADKVAYALDQLINRTEASSSRRYIGGNILYGTNTYQICLTSSGYVPPYPYYYGFDIIGFVQNLFYLLPEDFVIPGPSITLAEMISTLCDAANCDFIVNLDQDIINNNGGSFAAEMSQTYPQSLFGGIISIVLLPKNEYVDCNRPFSAFTYDLINLERPDTGDYEFTGNVNPGTLVDTTVGIAGNPLDINYLFRGTEGSYPYGGSFPVDSGNNSRGTSYSGTRASNISVSLKATPGTVGKMIVGGLQSRMNIVPRDYIYHYWGEITLIGKDTNSCGINSTSKKSIPVITQILPPNDTWDWIAIDMQDLFSNRTVDGLIYEGIYFASMMEIRAAGADSWLEFLQNFKPIKLAIINSELVSTISTFPSPAYMANIVKYSLRLGDDIMANIKLVQGEMDKSSLIGSIEEKVKNIYSTYYGKEWIAPVPVLNTKIASDQDNLVGNFEHSWDIADDAYVEPYAFSSFEAPKDASFMNNGRLKAYVNFEHSFPGTVGSIGYDLITGSLTGFETGVNYKYNFSSYLTDDKTDIVFDFNPSTAGTISDQEYNISGTCVRVGLAHVSTTVSKNYTMIHPSYFDYYNRGDCPFIDTVDGSGAVGITASGVAGAFYCYTYKFPKKDIRVNKNTKKLLESIVNDPNRKSFFSYSIVDEILGGLTAQPSGEWVDYAFYACDTPPFFNDHTFYGLPCTWGWVTVFNAAGQLQSLFDGGDYFAWGHSGTALGKIFANIVDDSAVANAQLEGAGLPFVRFSTKEVYYPDTYSHDGIDPLTGNFLDALEKVIIEKNFPNQNLNRSVTGIDSNFSEKFTSQNGAEKACVAPRSVAIPQQSNRYTYGPWVTNYDNIIYAGKFEYEQDTNLVPENFIIPIYGTNNVNWQIMRPDGSVDRVVESIKGSSLSGMAGLNLAGQATANSIDNFSLFAQEEGNITIPGLPIIGRLGTKILNGPRITDLNISFSNNQVQTTYNFRSLSPRYGKTNKDIIKRLQKLSNTAKTDQWLNSFFKK
jgi:hypothetical protein